jgi:putative mRNA 3-end processing factor
MQADDILTLTPQGLYCPSGDFHIDPIKPVPKALITHGHADHARPGHGAVLATRETIAIMKARYGEDCASSFQEQLLGTRLKIGGVSVSYHPAGHVLGSAQIAIEKAGTKLVVSGDYKRQKDPTCLPFEPVPCDIFITEATFGLPVFRHPPSDQEMHKLFRSLELFPDKAHLVGAYALGKAQRVISLLRQVGYDKTIYLHGALERLCTLYEQEGIKLGPLELVKAKDRKALKGEIVLCPPGSLADTWSRGFGDAVTSMASGWMRVRARARQRGVELPLILSDHADWDDLCATIKEVGAQEVWVTHGQEDALVHWCISNGMKARPLTGLGYGEDADDG